MWTFVNLRLEDPSYTGVSKMYALKCLGFWVNVRILESVVDQLADVFLYKHW